MDETIWVKELEWTELLDGKHAAVAGLQGRWRRWVSPSESNGNMVFGLGELGPGEPADWHEHPEAEVFFVLAGRGEAKWRVDGVQHQAPLREGVAFYKIGGIPHQMVCVGDEPLRGVYFKAGGK